MGAALAIKGATDAEQLFEAYLEEFLAPTLAGGQVSGFRWFGGTPDPEAHRAHRGQGSRGVVLALLFTGSQPHRRSVFQDKEHR
jgi:hypothetical protein